MGSASVWCLRLAQDESEINLQKVLQGAVVYVLLVKHQHAQPALASIYSLTGSRGTCTVQRIMYAAFFMAATSKMHADRLEKKKY